MVCIYSEDYSLNPGNPWKDFGISIAQYRELHLDVKKEFDRYTEGIKGLEEHFRNVDFSNLLWNINRYEMKSRNVSLEVKSQDDYVERTRRALLKTVNKRDAEIRAGKRKGSLSIRKVIRNYPSRLEIRDNIKRFKEECARALDHYVLV